MNEPEEPAAKEFRLWALLGWLAGVVVALMVVAAIVDVAVLGF